MSGENMTESEEKTITIILALTGFIAIALFLIIGAI